MSFGVIRELSEDGAFVELHGQIRRKPMQIPQGANPSVGDKVETEKIGGVWIIRSVYGGE